ncbi:MAG: DUF3365 domain-containing protein [Leptolyngbya sp. RL_3_1]|nr:DUF3365 domain-containing protein [Leptolyngbya sp. RL_3_1]
MLNEESNAIGGVRGTYHYTYKEAVLDPTNPADRVDDFEAVLTQNLKNQPSLTQLSGFRELPDQGSVFYSALPIRVKEQSCLQCHGAPEAAPPAMVARYGRENGFNWPLNEVIGTQVVYVPAAEVFRTAQRAFSSVISLFLGIFAIALLCLNLLLKPLVLQPIQSLARISQKLAADDIQSEAELQSATHQRLSNITQRQDELGNLGRIFQTMINQVVARQQRLQQQIHVLKIEVDEKRKAKEIEEITSTDYFQSLQQKAREIRNRKPGQA